MTNFLDMIDPQSTVHGFLDTTDWASLTKAYEDSPRKAKSIISKTLMFNHTTFLDTIYPILASVTPIKDGEKYSATKTLASIPDKIKTPYNVFTKEKFREYFMFLQQVPPSVWAQKPQTQDTRFCRLVPIFLATYKRYRNINYEEWEFSDINMRFFMNKFLLDSIPYRSAEPVTVEEAHMIRQKATLRKDGSVVSPEKWPTYKTLGIRGSEMNATSPFVLTAGQLWAANVKYRDEYMVLDMNDWDNMPESLDVVASEVIKEDYLKAPF